MLAHREPATASDSGSARSNEAGYTLLEVIIAVGVTAIIIVAIGYSVTDSLSSTTTVRKKVDASVLASLTAGVFTQDVANSTTNDPTAAKCVGDTPALVLPTSGTASIEYIVAPGSESGYTGLYRRSCNNGARTDQQLLGQTVDAFTATTSAPPCNNNVCDLIVNWTVPVNAGDADTKRLLAYNFTLHANRRVNA